MEGLLKEKPVFVASKHGKSFRGVVIKVLGNSKISIMLVEPINISRYFEAGDTVRITVDDEELTGESVAQIETVRSPATLFVLVKSMDIVKNKSMGHSDEDRRSFLRIEDILPIEVRRLDKSEKSSGIRDRIFKNDGLSFLVDSKLHEDFGARGVAPSGNEVKDLLVLLNAKVDFAIKYLILKEEKGFSIPKRIKVNISGSGLMYDSDIHFDLGEYLEIVIILPQIPPRIIIATSVVVRSEEICGVQGKKAAFRTALTFYDIDENDREAIIQYSIQKQMRDIRDRKNKNES